MKLTTRPTQIAKNPNHNLFKNGKNWWIHYTVHLPDYTSNRVRYSLGTEDLEQARMMRDMTLHDLNIKSLDAH
jgi:hypothetical protein